MGAQIPISICRGKWGKVNKNFQVSPKVWILQMWLFLCRPIKLNLGANTIEKVNIHVTFKYFCV